MPSPNQAPLELARPYIGGQAVLEGVMMRAPKSFAIVVRRRDGTLHVARSAPSSTRRKGFRRLPLVRGIASLVESLKLGSESLKFSAEQYERDLEIEDARAKRVTGLSALRALTLTLLALTTTPDGEEVNAPPPAPEPAKKNGFGGGVMLLVVIGFFIALPQAAAAGVNRWMHLSLDIQSPLFQALWGAFKLTIVVGYMMLIRRVPDIRRVFQYHGAEHKTISTYEANEELTVDNARAKTTLHPRCGTTFLVMVALVSILVFTAIGAFLPRIATGNALLDNVVFFLEKLPFLPLITAVTFEIQRVFARYCTTGPLRALLWPGFLVQKITTIEPDDAQLEIALASLKATLFRQDKGEAPQSTDDVRFSSYAALLAADKLRPTAAAA